MKKKIIYYLAFTAITATSAVLVSCDDSLGDDPGKSVGTGVSENPAQLVNAIYGPLQTLSSSYSFLLEPATETTISFEGKDDSKDGPQISILETMPGNWYAIKVFNRLYKSISAANLAIESVGALPLSGSLTQADKDLHIARARFIRGYDYFKLAQLFGEVPLILTTNPSESERTSRRSIDEVYTRIVADLTEASAHLPVYDARKSNPTQLAAKTILSKVYLAWGQQPLSQAEVEAIKTSKADPAKPPVNKSYLEQALALANEVIASNRYVLLPDFNLIWGVENENNAEVIFSIRHDGDGIDAQGNHQTHCGFTWPKDERADPHISYADISFENAMSAGDARRLYSYAIEVGYKDGNKDTLTWPLSIVRPGKWIHRSQAGSGLALDNQPNNIDHIDYRLAEVYLIKAEAAYFLGHGDHEGLPAINALRKRAGVAELETLTLQDLYNEWEYELAFEQKHWLNLVRWRTLIASVRNKVPEYEYYKEAYNNLAQFRELPNADESRFPFYQRIHKHLRAKVRNIDGHFYRFPIPLSEQYTDLGVTPQNPGY